MTTTFHSASFDAIGVTNQVTVTDLDALEPAVELARVELAALDLAASRFRDDSELTALNRAAGHELVVSALLLEAVETALAVAADTDGLVDPTVGAALRGLGYDRDYDVLATAGARPVFTLVPAAGWASVRVDRERSTIALRPGTELDLGATAKALAADRIAQAAGALTGAPVLVGLGGDIAVSGSPPEGWPVRIADHHRDEGERGPVVAIREGGLATSSTTVRRWRAGRVELHHIVEPSTGRPAPERWRTVSVAAATCVAANAAATSAIVLGDRAPDWLDGRGFAARLVAPDGEVLRTGGWPAEVAAGHS